MPRWRRLSTRRGSSAAETDSTSGGRRKRTTMSKSLKFEQLNSPVTTSSSSSIPLVKKPSEKHHSTAAAIADCALNFVASGVFVWPPPQHAHSRPHTPDSETDSVGSSPRASREHLAVCSMDAVPRRDGSELPVQVFWPPLP